MSTLFIIIAGTLWGLMGLFVRTLTEKYGFSSSDVTTIRLFFAGIMFFILLLVKDKKLLKVKLKHLWIFLCMGFFSVFCMSQFYFKSMTSDTSLSVSAILLYTAPIIVMISSCLLFKEKFTKRKLLALILAFVGCVFVCLGENTKVTPLGFAYGLCSGFAYGSYSIFGKIALRYGYSSYTTSGLSFIFAAVFSVIFGNPAGVIKHYSALDLTPLLILLTFGTAFVTAFLAFLFYTKGLEKTPAGKAAVIASVEPLVAALAGCFLGEPITLTIAAGMLGIISAIVLLRRE